jgi:peptide/nickel transport system permease protein
MAIARLLLPGGEDHVIRYVLRRLALMVPILLSVAFIVFSIMALTPGDPGSLILGTGADSQSIAQLNHSLGFDRPFWVRFASYIYNLVSRLDMGKSYYGNIPVAREVFSKLPVTTLIALNGMIFAIVVGIPLGVLSAVKQYSLLDTIPTTIALFLAAVPTFWLGMILMFVLSQELGWLPSSGIGSWKHYILPMVALGLPYASIELRFTRSSMLETIRQDYIRTARAKGAPERTVIWKHALKNALLPVITITGINFGALIGGAVITESLFAIPGLGSLIINSIRMKDVPMVLGATVVLAAIFSVVMLAVDLLYAFVDPRIKALYSNRR